jgi:hypothetical protein
LLPDLYKKIEDLVDKTALIKSLKEPEDKIGSLHYNIPPDQTVKTFS